MFNTKSNVLNIPMLADDIPEGSIVRQGEYSGNRYILKRKLEVVFPKTEKLYSDSDAIQIISAETLNCCILVPIDFSIWNHPFIAINECETLYWEISSPKEMDIVKEICWPKDEWEDK